MQQLVAEVKKLGVYTIVTDYHTDVRLSPGKAVADECWAISWSNLDALEKKCSERGVDGVFAAFSEFRVRAARQLCDRLGLPFYADMDQIDITRDKAKFKDACRANGLEVVEDYALRNAPTPEELDRLVYPVVIKPTDNAGSRGISVCYDEEDLYAGIAKALSFSDAKSIVAERYMDAPEVNVSYTIQDGKVTLSCASDAIPGYQGYGFVKLTDGWLFPSRYLGEFVKTTDGRIRNMIRNLGIRNGFLFITGFFDKGVFYIFEMGFRLGGGTTYNFISHNNGINYMQMMVAYSLTGKMSGWDVEAYDDPFFKNPCCNLTVMAKPGVIGHVGDLDRLRRADGILTVDPYYSVGQEIPDSGALSQTFARVNIIADSPAELADRIQMAYRMIDLKDENGEDMLLSTLSGSLIRQYWS